MTNEAKLPKTQAKALEILTAHGELEVNAWQFTYGANRNAIRALDDKGLVKMTKRVEMIDGEATDRFYYTVAA